MTHKKKLITLIVSVVIVLITLAIAWRYCPLCIHNNDDKILMYLTAGYATGEPEMSSAFGSFYWYGLISMFYRIYPGIAWYSVFQLIALVSSLIAIFYCFIDAEDNATRFAGVILFVAIFSGSLLFFSSAIQYTATVGIVGGASVCLMVVGCKKTNFVNAEVVASFIFFVIAFGLRKQFGIVTISALMVILFFNSIHQDFKESLARLIILIAVFELAYISNYAYEVYSGMGEFDQYYNEAGTWNDYPHLQYEGNEDIYKNVGWDETLYDMASDWFFMDKNVNEIAFIELNDNYEEHLTVGEYIDRAKGLLKPNGLANGQVLLWFFAFVLYNIFAVKKKYGWKRLLCADLLCCAFAVLVVHFLIKGRLPLRAYQSLIYIYALPFMVLFLDGLRRFDKAVFKIVPVALLIAFGIYMYVEMPETNMIKVAVATCNDPSRINDQKQFESLDNYAMAHSDNLYIYDSDLANPVGIFTTYEDNVPSNLMQWGGWQFNMPTYWKQLEKNGFETMGIKQFFADNVYFCSRGDMESLQVYVNARVPKAKMNLVENIDGVNIYKFTR